MASPSDVYSDSEANRLSSSGSPGHAVSELHGGDECTAQETSAHGVSTACLAEGTKHTKFDSGYTQPVSVDTSGHKHDKCLQANVSSYSPVVSEIRVLLGSSSLSRLKMARSMGFKTVSIQAPDIDEKLVSHLYLCELLKGGSIATQNSHTSGDYESSSDVDLGMSHDAVRQRAIDVLGVEEVSKKVVIQLAKKKCEVIWDRLTANSGQQRSTDDIHATGAPHSGSLTDINDRDAYDVIITGDQVLIYGGKILEKPASVDEARAMLQAYGCSQIVTGGMHTAETSTSMLHTGGDDGSQCPQLLSGRSNIVTSMGSVVMTDVKSGRQVLDVDCTRITLEKIPNNCIEAMLASGGCLYAAGACQIEHPSFSPFAKLTEGCLSGFIGLSLPIVLRLLDQLYSQQSQ